ncbi:hypothetical protein B0J12DRAFT_689559 [Macrophomina phaseolina]|uniref:Uncharacterized protein n=1 Tax=Macrophomina phaseolina TaxID=35725 RepID=A0ABQ8FQV0_9PEZI|nr:hypothetical protein B0J12DRAFT_689559 [Macrophomina phaseolina]
MAQPNPPLNHVCNLCLDVAPPLSGGITPRGPAYWFEIVGGSTVSADIAPSAPASGPELEVLRGGGDYAILNRDSGFLSLDVRVVAREKLHGDLFMFRNRGAIRFDNDKVTRILNSEQTATSTEYGEASMYESVVCNTASKEYAWMNFAVLVAEGRLVVEDGRLASVELRLFKVGRESGDSGPLPALD